MRYIFMYQSNIGKLAVITDEEAVLSIALPCDSEKYQPTSEHSPIMEQLTLWFDIYFSGDIPDFGLDIKPLGTDFQLSVWQELLDIPYGYSVTYGDIAKKIAKNRGISNMSAQAVGQAIGKNPIPILIPCHRVLGSKLAITGYGGGIPLKKKLLDIEHIKYN